MDHFDFDAFTWAIATQAKVVARGSQVLWVVPYRLYGGWIPRGHYSPRPCYAHAGD